MTSFLRPPFPASIDSSMLKSFKGCPRKAQLEYFEHWKPQYPSVHLHAGGAFAHGLEKARRAFYEDGKPHEEAVGIGLEALLRFYGDFQCPDHIAKTPARMAGALEFYFANYNMGSDQIKPYQWAPGKYGIEFSFATPLPVLHPTTGEPLIYSGRADMVGDMAGGLFIEDDKTASQLGASWQAQWDMRSQFSGYCWSAKQSGLRVDGVLVRGVSILKTKYETQQVITYRREWEMQRWLAESVKAIERMKIMWAEGAFDYNLDEECNAYGGCLFRRVCMSEDPTPWLEGYYSQRVWDPLVHQEREFTDEDRAKWTLVERKE
jgi:hypothetical protein